MFSRLDEGFIRAVPRRAKRRRNRRLAFCTLLGFAAGATRGAEAASPEDLIRQGIELRRTDHDAEALKLFHDAYDQQKTPRALAQIGLAEQALGMWGLADLHLQQALQATDDPWIRRNRAAIVDALKSVGRHVGHLEVYGTPAGAEVRIDGELVGRLPLVKPIAAPLGRVAIEVRAPGYLSIVRAATVSAGELVRESVNLQLLSPAAQTEHSSGSPSTFSAPRTGANPAASNSPLTSVQPIGTALVDNASPGGRAPPAPSGGALNDSSGSSRGSWDEGTDAHSSARGGTRPVLAVGFAGLAAVSLTVGILEHVAWQNKVNSFEKTTGCDSGLPQRGGPSCQVLYDDGQRARVFAFVGYGLAAALASTSAIIYFTDSPKRSAPEKLACAVVPWSPSVGCELRF